MECTRPAKTIITVAEMARGCGLSRSRFYSLMRDGVMPTPSRNPSTNRPYYTREQQEQCLLVRRTHCGVNGRPILFYAQRPNPSASSRPRLPTPRTTNTAKKAEPDPVIEELHHGLEQLGVAGVSDGEIRTAIAETHPDGHASVPTATLLMSAFRHLKCQNSPDNVG